MPGVPGGAVLAVNAYEAVYVAFGGTTYVARLALTAYELVDGIPNGKKILTN